MTEILLALMRDFVINLWYFGIFFLVTFFVIWMVFFRFNGVPVFLLVSQSSDFELKQKTQVRKGIKLSGNNFANPIEKKIHI